MRHNQSTLKASSVHARARAILVEEMEMRDYSPTLPASAVASLLLAACWQTSLSGACALVEDPPYRETLRRAIHACFPPKPRRLVQSLLAALAATAEVDVRSRELKAFALASRDGTFFWHWEGKPQPKKIAFVAELER